MHPVFTSPAWKALRLTFIAIWIWFSVPSAALPETQRIWMVLCAVLFVLVADKAVPRCRRVSNDVLSKRDEQTFFKRLFFTPLVLGDLHNLTASSSGHLGWSSVMNGAGAIAFLLLSSVFFYLGAQEMQRGLWQPSVLSLAAGLISCWALLQSVQLRAAITDELARRRAAGPP